YIPYWLPVRSRALHRRRFTTGLLQPFGQLLQIPRHRAESTDLEFWFLIRRSPHQTSRYALLVDIDSTAHIVMHTHGSLLFDKSFGLSGCNKQEIPGIVAALLDVSWEANALIYRYVFRFSNASLPEWINGFG